MIDSSSAARALWSVDYELCLAYVVESSAHPGYYWIGCLHKLDVEFTKTPVRKQDAPDMISVMSIPPDVAWEPIPIERARRALAEMTEYQSIVAECSPPTRPIG